ncbi:MAG: hypothetical protein AAFX81_02600 [Pseudomonadota bacterium]
MSKTLGLAGALAVCAVTAVAADDRLPVTLPPEMRDAFRAEMRGHMDTLDDLLMALAAGDVDEAADIAEIRMDFGHRRWTAMAEAGRTPEEIAQAKRALRQAGGPVGAGGMGGGGFGRYLPDDFRAMGLAMHESAQAFAMDARAVERPVDAAGYARLIDSLQFVTSSCRSCHATWRLE